MEKKKTYVITMSEGSYEDTYTNLVAITDDFKKGSAYVDKKNSTYQSLKKKMEFYYKDEIPKWMEVNPRPVQGDYNPIAIPKWKGNENITQEMRDERKKIVQKNHEIYEKALGPINDWAKKQNEFMQQWLKDNLTKEEIEMQKCMKDNYWEIEEVPWLE